MSPFFLRTKCFIKSPNFTRCFPFGASWETEVFYVSREADGTSQKNTLPRGDRDGWDSMVTQLSQGSSEGHALHHGYRCAYTHVISPISLLSTSSIHYELSFICIWAGQGRESWFKGGYLLCSRLIPCRALNTHIKSLRLNRFSFANLYRTEVQSGSLEEYTPLSSVIR